MADSKDHRAAIASPVKDLSETATKLADLSAKLVASDLGTARAPAEASAAIAAAAPRLATALSSVS